MYTYEQYIKDNILLSNSIVIKMLDTALAINKGLTIKYEILPSEDKREWKYFLNISGQKHFDNSNVELTVIETNVVEPLSLELLNKYPYTKRELLKNDYYYNQLIEQYPNDILFIHGCMYPVDINEAINARDGTILAYNPTLVQHNEYSLIKQLETHIKNYINRWYVAGYTVTDELFLPSFLMMLYSSLPAKIGNIRLDNIHTNEVHMFHLEHYFRGKLSIWDDIKILKFETIYWLYSNIDHLIKNTGKQTTLDKIILKIFQENGIGIGETLLRITSGDNIDTINPKEYSFTESEVITQNQPLNTSYTLNADSITSIENLVIKQIESVKEIEVHNKLERDKSIVKDVESKLDMLTRDDIKTKTLDINNTKLFNMNKSDIFKTIIDYWTYTVKHNYYGGVIEYDSTVVDEDEIQPIVNFVEPNSNNLYLINPKEGLLMLIKLLFLITKQPLETKLTKIYTDTVLDPERDNLFAVNSKLFQDGYTSKLVKELYERYPSLNIYSKNPDEFNRYLKSILKYNAYTWVLDVNSESIFTSANLKEINKRMTIPEEYLLTDDVDGKTVDELLLEHNIVFEINNTYNLYKSLDSLIEAFTKISMDSYKLIKQNMNSYINILNKLTSYTLQVIPTGSAVDVPLSIYYNNTNVIRSKKGVATVLDGNLYPYEDGSDTRITGLANNFREIFTVDVDNTPIINTATFNKIVQGVGYIDPELYKPNHEPIMKVDVMDGFIYDILHVYDKDIFILGATGKFTPYEDMYSKTITDTNAQLENIVDYWLQEMNPKAVTDNKIVQGVGYVDPSAFLINDPIVSIDVNDEFISDILDKPEEDKFILGATGNFVPYEENSSVIVTDARGSIDDNTTHWIENNNPTSSEIKENVEGVGSSTGSDEEYSIDNTDNIIVEIEDE